MITQVHIEGYKCFESFDIDLGPFTVLIGPNDSGKTAFLEAMRVGSSLLREFVLSDPLAPARSCKSVKSVALPLPVSDHWRCLSEPVILHLALDGGPRLRIKPNPGADGVHFKWVDGREGREWRNWTDSDRTRLIRQAAGDPSYYLLDPGRIREVTSLEQELESTRRGLPTVLDDLNRLRDGTYERIESEFTRRFPQYTNVLPKKGTADSRHGRKSDPGLTLAFRTAFGELPCSAVSDGVLLSLAFLTIAHRDSEANKLLLIEEPERGVHHASLKDIVATLRSLTNNGKAQIILTTHSPYLLDLVEPEDVRVFSKQDTGAVQAAKLSDYPDVQEMKKHFMTGEIWTSVKEQQVVAAARNKQ
jgi:hypothetical protein